MTYGESNSHVGDDVTWPWNVKVVAPIGSPISRKHLQMLFSIKGVVHKWRHAPMGEGVHFIVTMCDVGGGEKYCDVTHVTFTARPSQGVRDNSTFLRYRCGVGFLRLIVDNFDSSDIFLYHDFEIIMLIVAHLSEHKKSRCVSNSSL